jgi:hypothetical protein
VGSAANFVIPIKKEFGMLGGHSANDSIVIGLFPYASDARRAFLMLRERQFPSNEVAAAFEEPDSAPGDHRQWFGQLRQLYRAERTAEHPDRLQSMLGKLDLAAGDIAVLERDLKCGGAIVTVESGPRNQEAQALLERRGARIVQTHYRPPTEVAAGRVTSSNSLLALETADLGHIHLFGEVLRVHKEK